MPELPEVEIAARNLSRWLGGRTITRAEAAASRILGGASPAALRRLLVGRVVEAVERRGKWIRLDLAGGAALYSHLGMTGKWVRRPAEAPVERHERARLDAGEVSVRYVDLRLFGRLVLAPDGKVIDEWRALGVDPLVDGLPARRLGEALGGRRAPIKQVLLDQTVVAGIGNIQATEALWRARIDPRRPAASLDAPEVARLAAALRASIAFTLAAEKGPEITYVEEDPAANPFRVYGRAGQPCPRCKQPLERLVQAGRSTVWCPRCQRRAGG